MDLKQLRTEIDQLDLKILTFLNDRAKLASQIGAEKRKFHLSIKNEHREQQVLKNMTDNNHGPLSDQQIIKIFLTIINECRNIQQTAGKE